MKLLVKKTAPKKAVFTAINKAELKQVKGGDYSWYFTFES